MSRILLKGGALMAPVPPALITCGDMEKPNVMTAAWTGIINTRPPKTYVSIRPERYSYELIKKSGELVINLTTEELVFSLEATEGAPIDHLLGADGVAPGGIQHALGHFHLMYPVRRPHGTGIEVIIAFSPDFHPGDSGIRGGEDNLVIILHRVNHRSIGKVTGPQLIAQKHRRQNGQGYRPRFQGKNCLGTLCHREEQHNRNYHRAYRRYLCAYPSWLRC